MIYTGLSDQDSLEITKALDPAAIPHKMTGSRGTLLVPAATVHEARLRVAAQRQPQGSAAGYD